jgi:2-keto-4-pentenoate hydratase
LSDIPLIARELLTAYDQGQLIATPCASNPDFDSNAAYDVVAEIVRLRRARGETPVGRKIGFTNRNIWQEYGATSPIWACVFNTTLIHAGSNKRTLSLRGSVAPRIEPEIAFKLRAPVPAGCKDPAIVMECIEWLAPSFEVVDCHYAGWKFKSADSVADQSLHWRLIVGAPYAVKPAAIAELVVALHDCKVALKCGSDIKDRGSGANALGHPALAVAFLADMLTAQPKFEALTAGEVITTGTLTAALPIKAGETWTSEIRGLPVAPLTVTFSA